ncbi:MAG TPA: hypothetical protein VMZ52_17475 [Bryobacteraceae bacterium]|nr:hypothetical protein [Bryobacteraceae bacterium]
MTPQPETVVSNPVPAPVPPYRWYHKLAAVLAVILCFQIGVFLILFPWASEWDLSWFAGLPRWAQSVWFSPYFRGAISGLGLVNIYISFVEVFRLRRFAGPPAS